MRSGSHSGPGFEHELLGDIYLERKFGEQVREELGHHKLLECV